MAKYEVVFQNSGKEIRSKSINNQKRNDKKPKDKFVIDFLTSINNIKNCALKRLSADPDATSEKYWAMRLSFCQNIVHVFQENKKYSFNELTEPFFWDALHRIFKLHENNNEETDIKNETMQKLLIPLNILRYKRKEQKLEVDCENYTDFLLKFKKNMKKVKYDPDLKELAKMYNMCYHQSKIKNDILALENNTQNDNMTL